MVNASRQLAPEKSPVGRSPSMLSASSRAGPPSLARSASSVSSAASYKKAPPPPPGVSVTRSATMAVNSAAPPPYSAASVGSRSMVASAAAAGKRPPPPPPPLKPKPQPAVQYVVALYDFAAQADGDLSFSAGDRIEVVERTPSSEDWWTGRLNGRQGVFPGKWPQYPHDWRVRRF
jgi:amphiphysin